MKRSKEPIKKRYLNILRSIKNMLDNSNDIKNITHLRSRSSASNISNDSYLIKVLFDDFSVISMQGDSLKWTGIDPNMKMAEKLIESVKRKRDTVPSFSPKKTVSEEKIEDNIQERSILNIPPQMSKMEISIDILSGKIKLTIS